MGILDTILYALPVVAIFAGFYLLLIRPQQKKNNIAIKPEKNYYPPKFEDDTFFDPAFSSMKGNLFHNHQKNKF
ncbi:MAG: hypothetical protein RBT37_09645 [Dissulfurispiraceae bacterium]|jgi:hypothetical protein|nr:hypothetical protein [Dissulfurispiraceae bacterium]